MKGHKRWFGLNGKSVAIVILSIGVILTPLSIRYFEAKGSFFYEHIETLAEKRTTFRIDGKLSGFKLEGELPSSPQKP